MSSTDKLFKLASRFARKLSLGQQAAGDFQDKLQAAGLWDKSAEIAPMLNAVGAPDSAAIATVIHIDKLLNCRITATASVPMPPAPPPDATPEDVKNYKLALAQAQTDQKMATAAAGKLSAMLTAKYGAAMKAALAKSGLAVTDTMDVKWVTF